LARPFRALIAYDGTAYAGFQRQREGQRTIQGELERVLGELAQRPITIRGAGRTDSGVHATGQVVSFELEWPHGQVALQRAINANLPADIAVLNLEQCEADFHPRFDARRRAYKYIIYNAAVRSPIRRQYAWHVKRPLDEHKMNQAAQALVGVQDFATFGQPPQGENTVREVFTAVCQREGEQVSVFIEANAFLQRMVRSIVGSLKLVGEGKWTVEEFVTALEARDRRQCGTVAPPHGLYLVSVTYEQGTVFSKQ
jgi:tRNA pseudouridine38-40 synthase